LDRWEPLVVLRPGHQGIPPLVLIHATPGDVLGYGNLAAALPDELPCWGIVSRALHEPGRPHLALPEMARDYLDVLRTQLGDAPFALGGWCYGGLVAYEMACTLERAGKPAPLRLLLLETSCPRPAATLRALRWQLLHLRALLTLRPERRTAYLRRKIGLGPPPAPVDSPPSTPRRSATLARNMEAVARYRAGPYRRPIDLFLTTDPGIDALPLPAGGWSVLAPARTVHLSEGSHTDLLHPPHVADLARRVALLVGLPTAAS
jgi:thioesterase domain-containing protein